MSTIFGKLFRSKNKANKENVEPTELDREMSYHRSLGRGGSNQSTKSRRDRSTRFNCPDEEFIPATAPYHTVTAPKMHKGPQSCPGGYKDDFSGSAMNRSFESEFHYDRREKRERRHRDYDYKHKGNRIPMRETSEYGSGDPSPIAQFHRHSNYRQELDESENEGYEYQEKIAQLDRACRQFMAKLKHSEERHMHYKQELRKLQKSKDEAERVYQMQISSITKENQRNLQKIKSLEACLAASQSFSLGYDTAETASTTATSTIDSSPIGYRENYDQLSALRGYSNLPGSGPAQFFPLSSQTNRMNLMPGLLPSNNPTSSSSALGSVTGAGEAMTSDVSLLAPPLTFDSSFSRPLDSSNMDFNLARPIIDEMDETKNFRANETSMISIETPRCPANESGISIGIGRPSSEIILQRDDGYSTCSTLTRAVPSTSDLRRSSSDTELTSPRRIKE